MQFNSLVFVAFFILVYTLYILLSRNYKAQNILLLAGSYVFYGWFDWRFVSLLEATTIIHFFAGKQIRESQNPRIRKILLALSLLSSLTILGFFKYFNFFAENFVELLKTITSISSTLSPRIQPGCILGDYSRLRTGPTISC